MVLPAGTRIGTYQVISSLGAGGMGEVYRAHDPVLGRDVAIKVLPASFGKDPERLARFEREARLLAALNHPHIGAIYGVAETADGVRGLVLELIEGETLSERITRGLSQPEALAIASQIADALDLAHEKGIVHRDLKPDNIKITPDGAVKVLDFGIAKMSGGDEGAFGATTVAGTREGVMIGTAAFMSPEQARGKAVDKRADIWAFGCVLYEMLSGRRAFSGDTAPDAVAAVLERAPDWPALPATTRPGIVRLLKRCLEKDVRRRLRDIGDARVEIEDAIADVPAPAEPPRATRGRGAVAPWMLCGALLAALVLLLWRDREAVPAAAAPTPPRFVRTVRLTNTPEREFGPAISPDGKWIAYYSDARGPTDVWVKYLDSGATLNLTASVDLRLPTRTNIGGLAVTPDGKGVAFFGSKDLAQPTFDTWVIPAPLGGPPRKLLQGMQGAQWSPDGRQLACIVPGSAVGDALIVADADGTNPKELLPAEGGRHIHWPTWSADGRSIYFIYTFWPWNTEQSEIYRVAATGGKPEPVVRSLRRAVFPVPLPGGDLLFSANPDSVDLGLWWKPPNGEAKPLTSGIGEYAEAHVSADGRRLVSMVQEMRQSLVSVRPTDASPVFHPLTDGYGGDLDPVYDATSDRIVFSSTRTGYRNLWTARQDGTDPRPLTSGSANDHHPVFSPDGRTVVFVSDRGGQWGIWLVNAQGGAPRFLTAAIVIDSLTWSKDGTKIVFSTPGHEQSTVLSSVSIADGKVVPIHTPAAAIYPVWSPVSDTIAYLEPTMEPRLDGTGVPVARISLKFVDGEGRPRFEGMESQRFPNGLLAWSPDGRRVAIATVPANSQAGLWIVEPEGRTPVRKVMELKPTLRPRGLTWTKDGSLILSIQESLSDLVLHEIER